MIFSTGFGGGFLEDFIYFLPNTQILNSFVLINSLIKACDEALCTQENLIKGENCLFIKYNKYANLEEYKTDELNQLLLRTNNFLSQRHFKFLIGHNSSIRAVAISKDNKWIVSGSVDNTLIIWDTETGQAKAHLIGHINAITKLVISENNRWIVSASQDVTLYIWDAESGQQKAHLTGHTSDVKCVAVSGDNNRF